MALGSSRVTNDVDMIIECGNNDGVDDIFTKMKQLANQSEHFTLDDSKGYLEIKYKTIEIDCFDPAIRPMRPQYGQFLNEGSCVYIEGVNFVAPELLLREKLMVYAERRGPKGLYSNIDWHDYACPYVRDYT